MGTSRVVSRYLGLFAVALTLVTLAGASTAAKGGKAERGKAPASSAPAEAVNACGCYKDTRGACICTDKKAKCECPGECEPVGCADKREKEMEREMAAEVKRAQQQDADEQRRKSSEEAAERGEPIPDGGVSPDAGAPAAPAKKPGKARPKTPAKT